MSKEKSSHPNEGPKPGHPITKSKVPQDKSKSKKGKVPFEKEIRRK